MIFFWVSTSTLRVPNANTQTRAEGMGGAALIGGAYQQALATKNSLYAQINSATSVAAVQSVVWP